MTARELQRLSLRIRRLQTLVRALEGERRALIEQALAEGWTHARIAEATGLSRGRINQIAQSR